MTVPSQFFTPYATEVSGITNSNPAVITTTVPNNYDSTLFVRIVFPFGSDFGMQSFGDQIFQVTPIDPSTFSIDLDTTTFDPFVIPAPIPGLAMQVPQIIPVSETAPFFLEAVVNDGTIRPTTNWTNTTFPWVNNPNYVSP